MKKSLALKANRWPLRLLSSGASYGIPSSMSSSALNLNNISQRSKTILLSFCKTEKEEDTEYKSLTKSLQEILKNKLSLEIVPSIIPPHKLLNFESTATGLSTSAGIEVNFFFFFERFSISGIYSSNMQILLKAVYVLSIKILPFLLQRDIQLFTNL